MSQDPGELNVVKKGSGKVTYRSVERPNEGTAGADDPSLKLHKQHRIAAWCCLQSKSRGASVESGEAVKDHSDNTSSGCSVF